MIQRLLLCMGESTDPWDNLALEENIAETEEEDACILFLWQNLDTVVIGRNQCAWKECRLDLMEQEHVRLARRQTGGGAVYHDLGNLNFSFICAEKDNDIPKQLHTVIRACNGLNIPAEISGRNDLLVANHKFSGSAYRNHNGRSLHHGTLLVNSDTERLARYLTPSREKLMAKGVDSVRSRVINLNTVRSGLTIEELKHSLCAAFSEEYGLPLEYVSSTRWKDQRFWNIASRNKSREWNYGSDITGSWSSTRRFEWGEIEICLTLEDNMISEVQVYTDALNEDLPKQLNEALLGSIFIPSDITKKLSTPALSDRERSDLCTFFTDL